MNNHDSIQEETSSAMALQIFHRHLKVPIDSYLSTVQEFTDPWNERAYQYFIHDYLKDLGDPGIIGMVRMEKDEDYLLFDAAVRYPVTQE